MALLRAWASRVRGFLARRKLDADLDEELRSHVEFAVEENLRRGLTPDEARREALRRLGGADQIKESHRDRRGLPWLETTLRDVRLAVRALGANPGFAAAGILTLALGIGANTAIFTLTDALLLRRLPVPGPDELALVGLAPRQGDGRARIYLTNPLWEAIRDRQDVFSGTLAWGTDRFDLASEGEAQYARALYASGSYFGSLGVLPAVGRLFVEADDRRGCSGAVVLSYGFWQERYGGSPGAVGTSLSLNGHAFPILGVAARGFSGLEVGNSFDVALPLCPEPIMNGAGSMLDERAAWWLNVMGRRRIGLSPDQVKARLGLLAPAILEATVPTRWKPEMQADYLAHTLTPLPGGGGVSFLREQYDRPLKLLMVVVALLLLIACANIASLMLARGAARRREIALRLALGASRWRLVRQLLTECLVLSACGTLAGLFAAFWGVSLLVASISGSPDPVFLDIAPNARVLAFAAAISVLTALLFGVLPALRTTRVSVASAVRGEAAGAGEGPGRHRLGKGIVAAQVALSLVLLVAAGLFLGTYRNLVTTDSGFDRTNLLLAHLDLEHSQVAPEEREGLVRRIAERAGAVPGVISSSHSLLTPIGRRAWDQNLVLDDPGAPTGDAAGANFNFVAPGYFAALRTPLLAGRDFDEHDGAVAPAVAIVNDVLARRFFPGRDALGLSFRQESPPGQLTEPVRIVGIVQSAKYQSMREEMSPCVYRPYAQLPKMSNTPILEIRTAIPPSLVASSVMEAVTGVDRGVRIEFGTLERQVDDSLGRERLLASLSGFFGALGLLLTVVGFYGVMAYVVARRRKEIGIRMALGSGRGRILRLILGDVARILVLGAVLGAAASLAGARLVQSLLFGLEANDVSTLLGATGLLALAGLLAGYLPVRRASRLDPMAVLRED